MCIRDSYYLYDAFAGVKYDLDISKQPGNRIQNLTWMDAVSYTHLDVYKRQAARSSTHAVLRAARA